MNTMTASISANTPATEFSAEVIRVLNEASREIRNVVSDCAHWGLAFDLVQDGYTTILTVPHPARLRQSLRITMTRKAPTFRPSHKVEMVRGAGWAEKLQVAQIPSRVREFVAEKPAPVEAPAVEEAPAREIIKDQLVTTPRSAHGIQVAVHSLNRKLKALTSYRGQPITLYRLTAALEDGAIAIRLTEPDRSLQGLPDQVWEERFLDVNQSAVSLYRHGREVYHAGSRAALEAYLAEHPLSN